MFFCTFWPFNLYYLTFVFSEGSGTVTKFTTILEHSNLLITLYREFSMFLQYFAFLGAKKSFLIVSFRNRTLGQLFPVHLLALQTTVCFQQRFSGSRVFCSCCVLSFGTVLSYCFSLIPQHQCNGSCLKVKWVRILGHADYGEKHMYAKGFKTFNSSLLKRKN